MMKELVFPSENRISSAIDKLPENRTMIKKLITVLFLMM